ncbi:MAG TPA: histidine phosphatase family protein [Streptosporangiaceae bacterium]|nr:histidine phosphatase family protein [Streptosporangiaceae bacterium]
MTDPRDRAAEPASFHQHRFVPPPDATELVLVRHGQSAAYVDGQPFPLVAGQGDPPLSELGAEQARRVCARLSAEDSASPGGPPRDPPVQSIAGPGDAREPAVPHISAIYVTTLRRTAQTAAPLARQLGLDCQVEAGLREVHLGDWEGGLYRKMVAAGHPAYRQAAAEERWDAIPGAEPAAEFAARVRDAITRLAAAHPGQRIAAFTHGGVIGQVLALAAGSRPFAFIGADNASISRIVITGDLWIVRGFNDTAHLD